MAEKDKKIQKLLAEKVDKAIIVEAAKMLSTINIGNKY